LVASYHTALFKYGEIVIAAALFVDEGMFWVCS
jgi:hypothetical protein